MTAPNALNAIELLQSQSLAMLVQDMLERAIVSGEYLPGEKLNEVDIATRLNVSRGPVREAFRALEQAGLLRNEKNRGVTVRVVPLREAEEIYEVRAMLDESVARALAKRISPDTLKALKGIIQSMKAAAKARDVTRYTELNVQFHDAMVVGVGNTHLTDTYRRLVRQLGLLRQAAIEAEEDALSVSVSEHEKIVQALGGGDEEKAVALVREHVAHGLARMRRTHGQSVPAAGSAAARAKTERV
ncbi:phosphonate utilization associated transcriptional regulator [Burkholderia stagnalis]|uniref:phosphonate utilization associated transcriptional regulator n=1 Tax=Burkholderia stagnalis TaxID=1503054 RepID=UPI00075241E7|nr:phosphonate utilization associated transcriptional regulator [Burkholderia stagnalis]KVC55616.1 phosphonate utilization associated transcriptional regulator [Burkholderia stagnalis]KVD90805.1 phosphonate utilization associated transcriptional regulator [Burkholderia stagnalis]KVN25465.1 phosphonate utilization associated transcriptional regulator [Burkholderia stagnalis]KWI68247.1 phosphonate utilization associated transcriptional regulator [Burkholderia stagnalis]KWK22024.1 phosphonate uti